MVKVVIRDPIGDLEKTLERYSKAYYAGTPEVSDEAYDAMCRKLAELKPESQVLNSIGTADFEGGDLVKVPHRMSMHSQSKARNLKELEAWLKKLPASKRNRELVIEHKLDGLSVELVYEKSKLVHVITQGEVDGYDILANVKGSPSIPLMVHSAGNFSVRGELIMETKTFQELYVPKGYTVARNTAVGLARKGGKAKDLRVVCYSLSWKDPKKAHPDEVEQLEWLTANGFEVVEGICSDLGLRPDCTSGNHLETITELYEALSAERMKLKPNLKYEIDGLVIKCAEPDLLDLASKMPKTQIALKFPPRGESTILRKVVWQAKGSTYTPVGVVDPVEILGATVSRANLCNPAFLTELGAYIGAEVLVTKRGDVIPKIEAVLSEVWEGKTSLVPPKECRVCETPLKGRSGRRCWCPNDQCPLVVIHQVSKWLDVLGVKFFGDALILGVCVRGMVGSIADLYDLDPKEVAKVNTSGLTDDEGNVVALGKGVNSNVRRVGLKVATKALNNLVSASNNLPLAKLIAGLDIFSIGLKTFQLAVKGVTCIDDLFELDRDRLLAVKGLGEKKVDALLTGLAAREGDIRAIASKVVIAFPSASPLEERGSVCFTGKMSRLRKDLEAAAAAAGFEIRSSVSAKLTYLVTNDAASGSAKNEAARAKGVKVIDEAAFEAML